MPSINECNIMGHVGQKPELRFTKSDTPVTNISVATNRHWKDSNGQKQEDTEWHRVVIFGPTAKYAAEHVDKGALVHISGRLQTREWEHKGQKRKSTEIVCNRLKHIGDKKQSNGPGGSSSGSDFDDDGGSDDFEQSFDDDDIPF